MICGGDFWRVAAAAADGMTLLKKMTAVAMINEKASNSSSSSTEMTPKAAKWNEGFEKKLLIKIRLY